jgi:hypothetical protein
MLLEQALQFAGQGVQLEPITLNASSQKVQVDPEGQ